MLLAAVAAVLALIGCSTPAWADAGVQPVYSLRVDTADHAFITNGFVSHNTEARDVLLEASKIPGPVQPLSQDLLAKVNAALAKGK